MANKKVYTIDGILIVGSIFVLIFLIGYSTPLIISPVDELESKGDVLFSVENAEVILIDDNLEFTSPQEYVVSDDLEIKLEPGTYYWKAKGLLESDIRRLTINSVVDLRLKKRDKGYDLVNAGNVVLDVDVYNGTELVEEFSLDTDRKKGIFGSKIFGRKNG